MSAPSSAPTGAPVRVTPSADLRLLAPALVAWAAVALLLGRGPVPALMAAAGALSAAATLGLIASRRRARSGGRRRRGEQKHAASGHHPVVLGRAAVFGLLVVTVLLTGLAGSEARDRIGPVEELAGQRAHVRVLARVASEPRRLRQTEAGPVRVVVDLRVEEVTARGVTTAVDTPVLLIADESWLQVGWRHRVAVTGRLAPSRPGERARAVLTGSPPTSISGPGPAVAVADVARAAMTAAVEPLPPDPRGLVPALVIGDRDGLPEDLTQAMVATGMSHLTAVSGTNCTLVVGAAVWCCSLIGVPRRGRPLVAGAVLVGFVVLARPDPSVLRAAVMGGVGLLGVWRSRRAVAMPALAGAVLILLLVDPWLARTYGFALSVLATLGLLLFAGPWADAMRARAPWLGPGAEALAVPLAAQVTCAPVIVLLQGEISVVGVLANALAAPLVAPATILGAGVAVLGVPWPWGATMLAWGAALPTWLVAAIARAAARAPLRAVPWPDDARGALALAAVVLVLVLSGRALARAARRRVGLVVFVMALVLAVTVPLLVVRTRTGFPGTAPAVVMCDVGQGDAFVLTSGPGRAVVVDVGPDPTALDRCLDRLGVRVVDAVVLTHFDLDHVGGLSAIDDGRTVGDVVVSGASMTDPKPDVVSWWESHGRPVHAVSQGEELRWGSVAALVRGPRAGATGLSPNAGSLVLDVAVDGAESDDTVRALLLADVDEEAGRVVRTHLSAHPVDQIGGIAVEGFDLVKVAHHGSADHDPTLLADVTAPAALVSVGEDNRYGHPAPRLLESVRAAGSVVYRSDVDGAVAVSKSGGALTVVRERRSRVDPQ